MKIIILVTLLTLVLCYPDYEITVSNDYVLMKVKEEIEVTVSSICFNSSRMYDIVQVSVENEKVVTVEPQVILLDCSNQSDVLYFEAKSSGRSKVNVTSDGENIDFRVINSLVIVDVYKYFFLYWFSVVTLWAYSFLLGLAYYPQIYINYRRKSVIGLSFDFILLSAIEYAIFFLFYIGLNYLSQRKESNFFTQPNHLTQYKPNGVVYSVHGVAMFGIILAQCFFYDKTKRNILSYSKIAIALTIIFVTFLLAWGDFELHQILKWLYATLVVLISVSKFIPQIVLNYKHKSTKGLSKSLIYMKTVAGFLILIQLFMDSLNFGNV
ncbi:hypothetical protein FQR65_LT07404 [Abscondita terminalis]|nr:hypothetical protein FQR65_LT07404 [Abscondita terminalis]